MTAPGGRGDVPDPSAPPRRRPSIAVSDLMSGGDGQSSRRRAGDGYSPPPGQNAPPVTSHSARATPPASGPPPPPALQQHRHSHSSFAYRREQSPGPLPPEGRGPSSSSSSSHPRYSHSHPGAPPSYAPPLLYDGSRTSQLPLTSLRHSKDPVDDRQLRDYDSGRAYDRWFIQEGPGAADSEDPRRMPMAFRYDYPRDYPIPDRPPQREGSLYPSPPPHPHHSGPSASGPAPPIHDHPPHGYPQPSREPPMGLAPVMAEVITASSRSGSPSRIYDRGVARPRSPLPPPSRAIQSRGRDDLPHSHPTPPSMPPNRSATYFTPAPKYNPKGLSANDTALYTRGYHDAMKAVQHGVVWIEGKTYSQIPMYLPDPLEWNQPHDGRREPHDRHPSVDRSYSRPQPIWDERDVKRENLGPYGPSRSHSDPVPRLGVAPYPPDFYRPSAPPGYGYPPQMEPGPPHYPVHMSGPPMGPYMGGEYGPRYYPVPMRPPGQQMRSRQQISCHPCRNRKVKCSGTTPCEACIKIKREHECVYEKTVRRRGKGKKAGTTTDENGDSKPDTGEEGQSEDDRRDVSTSPSRGRMDFERRVDDRERRDEDEGERVSRSADRKRPHSRSRSPRRRSALGPRHQRDSP